VSDCATCSGPAVPAAVALGGSEYYQLRYDDFKRRHPDKEPPSYYLGYGKKYADRFMSKTWKQLSPEGQAWLLRARRKLQEAIEAKRIKDPAAFDQLEQNDAAFKRFVYDTHPKAYVDAGLLKLPLRDITAIGLTPDLPSLWPPSSGDLFTSDGAAQIWTVVKTAGPNDYLNVARATVADSWSATKTALAGAWTSTNHWWSK
jgi:hypothetical protein